MVKKRGKNKIALRIISLVTSSFPGDFFGLNLHITARISSCVKGLSFGVSMGCSTFPDLSLFFTRPVHCLSG